MHGVLYKQFIGRNRNVSYLALAPHELFSGSRGIKKRRGGGLGRCSSKANTVRDLSEHLLRNEEGLWEVCHAYSFSAKLLPRGKGLPMSLHCPKSLSILAQASPQQGWGACVPTSTTNVILLQLPSILASMVNESDHGR